jgi:hypothetical protein
MAAAAQMRQGASMEMGRGERANAAGNSKRSVSIMRCQECGCPSSLRWWGWRAYRTDDPELNEPPTLAFYCPACAEREFGAR